MAYLDVSPMIAALSDSPAEFDVFRGRLRHVPSGHRVMFDRLGGNAWIEARCDCASLRISQEQSRELQYAFLTWKEGYWRVARINRDFSSHFGRGPWRRFTMRLERYARDGLAALGRVVSGRRSQPDPEAASSQVPAE
jgi:hypothetical protein